MMAIAFLFVRMLGDCFKSRQRLEAEILVLRHQLNVLQQRAPRRVHLHWASRALFIWLYRCCPRILDAITIVRPETVVRWHRMGFAAYWRWKSRSPGGRPRIGKEVRDLIRRMSFENPLWGAPRIHGELLRLGFDVAQSTVSIYMVPRRDRPSQTWKTFLRNHAEGIASIDLFVVPTISFEQLYAFLILSHRRRRLLWTAVTNSFATGLYFLRRLVAFGRDGRHELWVRKCASLGRRSFRESALRVRGAKKARLTRSCAAIRVRGAKKSKVLLRVRSRLGVVLLSICSAVELRHHPG